MQVSLQGLLAKDILWGQLFFRIELHIAEVGVFVQGNMAGDGYSQANKSCRGRVDVSQPTTNRIVGDLLIREKIHGGAGLAQYLRARTFHWDKTVLQD